MGTFAACVQGRVGLRNIRNPLKGSCRRTVGCRVELEEVVRAAVNSAPLALEGLCREAALRCVIRCKPDNSATVLWKVTVRFVVVVIVRGVPTGWT